MADPARYFISPLMRCETDPETGVSSNHTADIFIERHEGGHWIKHSDFEDYKAAQGRNRREEVAVKLGLEIVALRTRMEDMERAGNKLAKAVKRLGRFDDEGGENAPQLIKDWEDATNA